MQAKLTYNTSYHYHQATVPVQKKDAKQEKDILSNNSESNADYMGKQNVQQNIALLEKQQLEYESEQIKYEHQQINYQRCQLSYETKQKQAEAKHLFEQAQEYLFKAQQCKNQSKESLSISRKYVIKAEESLSIAERI